MLKEDDKYFLFAGDVVFDLDRLANGKALAGIVENLDAAKGSIVMLENQMSGFDTYVATAHDDKARVRAME